MKKKKMDEERNQPPPPPPQPPLKPSEVAAAAEIHRRHRSKSTPKKKKQHRRAATTTPILPKDEKPKPLFIKNNNKFAARNALEETWAIKQTLSSLRTLFNGETLTYYDQFSLEPRRSCFVIVFAIICCFLRIALEGLILGMTISFHSETLTNLVEAFESVYPENEESNTIQAPAIPASVIQIIQSLCIAVYVFCFLAILVDVSLILSTFLRHVRAISISLATGFFLNFWLFFILFSIAIVGFNQEVLLNSFIGNIAFKDFQNNPHGDVIHRIQEQYQCCGFNSAKDWHNITMFEWQELGTNESRSIPFQSEWTSNLNLNSTTRSMAYYSPKSCCISEFAKNSTSKCNQSNMTLESFTKWVNENNFKKLSGKIGAEYPKQMNTDGCIGVIGQQIMEWGYYALGTSIGLCILWFIVVIFLNITLAESTGMGSVNPRTQLVDPTSLKNLGSFSRMLDEMFCCCGNENSWPIRDDNSEMEAIRDDRRALVAIEEGRPLNEIALAASTSNLAFFLPSFKELQNFVDEPSDKQQPKNEIKKQ